jgi:general secretion pathway protein I
MTRRPPQSGFSLLEALVAIAIVALALAPILNLQAELARDAARQNTMALEATATQNALALLSTINPMTNREGQVRTGAMQVRWRASAQSTPVRSTLQGAGEGAFMVQQFQTEVVIYREDGARLTGFTVEQLGWRNFSEGEE